MDEVKNVAIRKLWADYLKYSYIYYVLDRSEISDYEYDNICRQLVANKELFVEDQEIPYKDLYDEELLRCGSGFCLKYPNEFIKELS